MIFLFISMGVRGGIILYMELFSFLFSITIYIKNYS